jgi:hypothetical protein
MSLLWSTVSWTAGLLTGGLVGWLWSIFTGDFAWKTVPLTMILTLAALMGITWSQSHARTRKRWLAALDAYAEREQARVFYLPRNSYARPQSQDW